MPRQIDRNLRRTAWGLVGIEKYFCEKTWRPYKSRNAMVYCPKIDPIKISTMTPIKKTLVILIDIKLDEIVSTINAKKYSGQILMSKKLNKFMKLKKVETKNNPANNLCCLILTS